ncbi:MAG: hypothetical protein EOP09_09880 [Proteobacteria bacterium]|nr:MAG: hypothetical protein EOP09_09880 [Pseudomonadota bacterium]
MRSVINSYGVAFCKAKFGSASTPTGTPASLVRHLGTTECKDTRVTLAQESCLQSCSTGAATALALDDLL